MKLSVMLLVGAIMLMLCLNMVNSEEEEEEEEEFDGSGSGSGAGPDGDEAGGEGDREREAETTTTTAKSTRTIVKAPKNVCKPVRDDCDENKAHHIKCCHADQGVRCQKIKGPHGKEHKKCVAPPGFKPHKA